MAHIAKELTMQNNATSRKQVRKFNSDFWKYWTGQTISNLGSSITLFALPLLVYKISGSALDLGIASAATFLPYLLFGLILGAWADRVNRKRMMICTDIGRAHRSFDSIVLCLWLTYYLVDLHCSVYSRHIDDLLRSWRVCCHPQSGQ